MKRIKMLMAAVAILACGMQAAAQDCASQVDKLCEAFNTVGARLKLAKTLNQMDALNFDAAIEEAEVDQIPDECLGYVLTAADKTKLSETMDKFLGITLDKTYELTGGKITKTQITRELDYIKKGWANGLEKSKTLGEFVESFDEM